MGDSHSEPSKPRLKAVGLRGPYFPLLSPEELVELLLDRLDFSAIAVDDTIYKAGKMPCKPCPTGTACSKLGGLCEATATP
ncbi:hypothetical protein ANCDUO_21940 [Ancylostoma duodenale]|uniref:Uncharacterized protein n=1 Tax=Ancylostoma duodenale TaxID=51022 RepID=A0A0C2FHE7_9BILA|nr:hypothetical protein ANCDUO_21940 [Ancylostoma duodenale]